MTEKNMTRRENEDVQESRTLHTDSIYIPNVDISENSERILLVADMPGVDQKSVSVTVENNVLTVEGQASVEAPEGYELAGREYGVGKYRRDFTLSDAVDTNGIKARVRHGVLELIVPKQERVKTKKIEIEA